MGFWWLMRFGFLCLEILPIWISLLVMVKLEEDHSKQTQNESDAR